MKKKPKYIRFAWYPQKTDSGWVWLGYVMHVRRARCQHRYYVETDPGWGICKDCKDDILIVERP